MTKRKPPHGKSTENAATGKRKHPFLAPSKPMPLPKRKRMNDTMRERLGSLVFSYKVANRPFRNHAELLETVMYGVDSFYVTIRENRADVGELTIHTIPLLTGEDLHAMADASHIPHWQFTDTIRWDMPSQAVMSILEAEGFRVGDKFMIVENIKLVEEWRGWGLEPVFTGIVMDRVRDLVDRDLVACVLYAVLMPVPWWLDGEEEKYAQVVNRRTAAELGFRELDDVDGDPVATWVLPGFEVFYDRASDLRERLRLPEHLFTEPQS